MDTGLRNDFVMNGQSPSQMILNCLIQTRNQKDEEDIVQIANLSPCRAAFEQKTDDANILENSKVKFMNGSTNKVSHPDGNNGNKSVRARLAFDCHQETVTSFTSLKELNSEGSTKIDTVKVVTEISKHCEALLDNAKKQLQNQHYEGESKNKYDISVGYLESELDSNCRLSNEKLNCCVPSHELNLNEDSRLLETMLIELHDGSQQMDRHVDDNVMELQSFAAEVEKSASDEKKSQKVKTSDNFRPFAELLHDLGQELVRQLVYQDLIEIQMEKNINNELDEKGSYRRYKIYKIMRCAA